MLIVACFNSRLESIDFIPMNLSASLIKLVRIAIAFLVNVKLFPLGLLPDSAWFSMRDYNSKFFVFNVKFSKRSLSLFSLSFCNNWFNLETESANVVIV